jgi:ankyrin repeat protein
MKEFEGGNIERLSIALSEKDNLNYLLSFAMNSSKALSAEVLMQYGADPTCKDNNGDSVLIWAIKKKKLNIIGFLLDHHDHLFTTEDEESFQSIHEIAFYGFYKAVSLIIDKFPHLVDSQIESGKTPLHLAVREGNFKTFVELLKFDANQAITDENGLLPIHFAAINNRVEMLQVLLDWSVSFINYPDPFQLKTALHLAAERGHISIVQELLERGADVSLADSEGFLSIHLAAAKAGHADIVKMIMDYTVVDQNDGDNRGPENEREEEDSKEDEERRMKEEREKPTLTLPPIKKPRF